MSNSGNTPPDEPTRAYTPVTGNDDATRIERPVPAYDEDRVEVSATELPPGYKEEKLAIAPLVTVGLLAILIGLGLGYLLFHNSGDDPESDTTTTTTALTTTTLELTTTSSSTTSSTTTSSSTTSTTVRPTTTTTARPTTTSTTARNDTATTSTTTANQ